MLANAYISNCTHCFIVLKNMLMEFDISFDKNQINISDYLLGKSFSIVSLVFTRKKYTECPRSLFYLEICVHSDNLRRLLGHSAYTLALLSSIHQSAVLDLQS